MIRKNDNPATMMKNAVALFVTQFGYSDIVTREWFCEAFGITYPRVTSVAALRKIDLGMLALRDVFDRTLLREHKMALRSIGHGEWEIVPPNEQAEFAQERTASAAMRAFARGREIIENTRTDELTAAEKKARTDTLARLGSLEHMLKKRLSVAEIPVVIEAPDEED